MQRSGSRDIPLVDTESDADEQHAHGHESRDSRWDLAIEFMLAPLLLFMPLALGTVEPWSELIVLATVTVMSVCLVGKLIFQRGATFLWSWAYVPVALFIACVGLQLLPLPAGLVKAISPHTLQLKSELLADVPDAGRVLNPITLSFYRPGTLHDLRIVLVAAALMVIVANTFRTPRQIRRLMIVVAAAGGVVGMVALIQDVCQTHSIYGLFPNPSAGTVTGGPFVNRSHFAQFMNLSIGFAIGLLLVRLHELFPGKDISPARLATPWREHGVWPVWLAVAVIVVGATAVCLSLSRAGLISMIVAGTVIGIAIAFSRKSRGRGSFLGLLALIVFACVLYLGFDAISERFTTTHDVATAGGRLEVLKDLRPLWRHFPILGTGLGTHQTVFPNFDKTTTSTQPDYVEVELAQVMEEMGAVGVILVLTFVGMIAVAFARGLRRKHPIHGAAMGLAFGLGAVFLHSFTDFGQHFLPNASLSAIACGLLLALSRSMRPSSARASDPESAQSVGNEPAQPLFPLRAGVLACAAATAILALLLPDAISARRAAVHADRADAQAAWLTNKQWSGSDDDFHDLITEASQASHDRPDDVYYHYLLNQYRWRSICRTPDGQQTVQPDENEQWIGFARRLIDELQKGRLLCPTYGPAPALAGEIKFFYLNEPAGADLIRLGARLSPHDSFTCFIAGELDGVQGKFDSAVEHLTRAVSLDPGLGDAAINFCLDQIHRPDLAVELAQEKPQRLMRVADSLDQRKTAPDISRQCRDRAFSLLSTSVLQPDPPAADLAMLGGLYFQRRSFQTAAEYYTHALEIEYAQPLWHLKLAQCLVETGRHKEAYDQALITLRLAPGQLEAEQVLDRTRDQAGTRPAVPSTQAAE